MLYTSLTIEAGAYTLRLFFATTLKVIRGRHVLPEQWVGLQTWQRSDLQEDLQSSRMLQPIMVDPQLQTTNTVSMAALLWLVQVLLLRPSTSPALLMALNIASHFMP